MGPRDGLLLLREAVLVIDLASAVVLAAYVGRALVTLVQGRATDAAVARARFQVADGAILGLSLKVAATLLKTLELASWQQILMFAAIFGLRTVLKQLFTWEAAHMGRAAPGPSARSGPGSAEQQQQ